jgi:hypothetical protein
MANLNAPFGGRVINTLVAADFNSKVHTYHVSTADATPIFVGDFVKLSGSSNADGIPYITQASAISNPLLGVVVGIKNIYTNESQLYRSAYTDLEIEVMDDPLAEFEVQVNGVITTLLPGFMGGLIVGAGNTFTGMSGMQIDVSTLGSASQSQIQMLGVLPRSDNVVGLYTKVRCKIANHVFAFAPNGINYNITAHAGGGQTNAVSTPGNIIYVTTVASTGDSIRLRSAKAGDQVTIKNDGANTLYAYPNFGEKVATSTSGYISVAAGKTVIAFPYYEYDWYYFTV